MKNEGYGFVELFDKIDSQLIKEAERDFVKKTRTPFFHSGLARAACAAICISLGALCLFQPQVQAAMKEFAGWISRIWQTGNDLSPYTEVINKQETEDGFTLCLDEVILSDNRVYAAVTVETEYPEGIVAGGSYVTINGKDYPVENIYDQAEDIGQELGEQVPHHVYTFVLKDRGMLENVTDMGLHFTAYRNDGDFLEGKNVVAFDFEFSASKEDLQKNVIRVPVDQTITLKDETAINFRNLTLTRIDSSIEAEIENSLQDNNNSGSAFIQYYLEGKDSFGNPVQYVGDINNGKNLVFICDMQMGMIPSVESEWVELQLFFYEEVQEKDQQSIDTVDGEDIFVEDNGDSLNRVEVGEPFRVHMVPDHADVLPENSDMGGKPAQIDAKRAQKG